MTFSGDPPWPIGPEVTYRQRLATEVRPTGAVVVNDVMASAAEARIASAATG